MRGGLESWILMSERHGFKSKLCDFRKPLNFSEPVSQFVKQVLYSMNSIYFIVQGNNPHNGWETIFKL